MRPPTQHLLLLLLLLQSVGNIYHALAASVANDFNSVGTDTTTTSELLALGHFWRIQDMGTGGKQSNWFVDSGRLRQSQGTCDTNYNSLLLTGGGGRGWSDYCVSIKLVPATAESSTCTNFDIGIVLRHQDERNYYRASLKRTSTDVYKVDLTKHSTSGESSVKSVDAITNGATSVLMACVAGNHFSVYHGSKDVSATPTLTYRDTSGAALMNGAVGLSCRGAPCGYEDDFLMITPPTPFELAEKTLYLSDGSGEKNFVVVVNEFYRHSPTTTVYVQTGKDVRVVAPTPGFESAGGSAGKFDVTPVDEWWNETVTVRGYSSGMNLPVERIVELSLHPDGVLVQSGAEAVAVAAATDVVYDAHSVNKAMDWEGGDAYCSRSSLRVCTFDEYCPAGEGACCCVSFFFFFFFFF